MYQPEGNYYNKYESRNPVEKFLMQGFFDAVDSVLDQIRFESVYEAGCGEGYFSAHIVDYCKRKRTGNVVNICASDLSKTKIRDEAEKRFPEITFEVASIYELPHENEEFDLVVACEVLEHLDKPRKALHEVMRISNKNILVSVPREPIWRMANMARGKYLGDLGNTPGHVNHWSKTEFMQFIKGEGGRIIHVRSPFPWTIVLFSKD